jgi:tRNA1Val (adenine37-N6)-methyltransferase
VGELLPREDETLDTLFGGRLKVLQKRNGFRFAMDPVLLTYFARPLKGLVLDLGTGCGIIPLILAARGDVEKAVGMDIQEELIQMARRSAIINSLEEKVQFLAGDFRRIGEFFGPQSFSHVLSNPPYHSVCHGRPSPKSPKALARQDLQGDLRDVIGAARYVLGTKGRLWLTYSPGRLAFLVESLKSGGFEPKTMRFVHGREDLPATVVLVEAVKGGKEGLKVLPPLILYTREGDYTEELQLVYSMLGGSFPREKGAT